MTDDRTSRARLRDAAIELVADGGMRALSARAVAERAGLSPGLIRHHFGSMAELVHECDAHVAADIRRAKEEAIQRPVGFDPLASLRAEGRSSISRYLAARLAEDSPRLDQFVDTLVADAEGYLSRGEEAGAVRPTGDEHQRAAVLTVFSLGTLVMHRHLTRLTGFDLTSQDFVQQPGYLRFIRIQLEVFAALFEPAVIEEYLRYIDSMEEQE